MVFAAQCLSATTVFFFSAVPIWAVARFRLRGALGATVFLYVLFTLDYPVRYALTHDGGPAGIGWLIWLVFGLFYAAIFVSLVASMLAFIAKVSQLVQRKLGKSMQPSEPIMDDRPFHIREWKRQLPRMHPVERIVLAIIIGYVLTLAFVVFGFDYL